MLLNWIEIVSPEDVDKVIAKLKRNRSPGIDGVTAEFLIYGRSGILCQHLAALYSNILTHNYVPSVFVTGVLVPVLKKLLWILMCHLIIDQFIICIR